MVMVSGEGACFFFQAEDGIRDLVRSRGLGDVYKRQLVRRAISKKKASDIEKHKKIFIAGCEKNGISPDTVSYTHLTLPTIYSV